MPKLYRNWCEYCEANAPMPCFTLFDHSICVHCLVELGEEAEAIIEADVLHHIKENSDEPASPRTHSPAQAARDAEAAQTSAGRA